MECDNNRKSEGGDRRLRDPDWPWGQTKKKRKGVCVCVTWKVPHIKEPQKAFYTNNSTAGVEISL